MSAALARVQLEQIAKVVQQRFGIHTQEHQEKRLELAVLDVMKEFDMTNPDDFCSSLATVPNGTPWLTSFIDAVTVEESYFYRDSQQFDWLKSTWLPRTLECNRQSRSITIWSAACSYGQEPYTVAMILAASELIPRDWEVNILGSDLSPNAIDIAKAGEYSNWSMRAIPDQYKRTCFDQHGNRWKIKSQVAQRVKFFNHNLISPFPALNVAPGSIDLIICRNVLIYFQQAEIFRILEQLSRGLSDTGVLMLGATDFVDTLPTSLAQSREVEGSILTKRTMGDRPVEREPSPREAKPKHRKIRDPEARASTAAAASDNAESEILRLLQDSQYDLAKRQLAIALAKTNTNYQFWLFNAILSLARDEIDDAFTSLKKALFLNRKIPEVQYYLSVVYFLQGDKRQAKRALDSADEYSRGLPPTRQMQMTPAMTAGEFNKMVKLERQQLG